VEPVKEAPKAEPVKQEAAQTEVKPDKYDQMDARVRTGAYRIVGTDHIVKVKAGETLPKIARRTLGPDMECYIEVFNGIKSSAELKEGQSIKIPKLELKKKKKKANN
jgi:LysM repeat protein